MTSDTRDKLLLELAERVAKASAALKALDPASPSYDDDFDELATEAGSAEDAIMRMQAFTLAGMAAKLAIALRHLRDDCAYIIREGDDYPLTAAVLSVGRDIDRLASHA